LVCLIQSFKCRFVISRIEGDVAPQVWEELGLLGNGALVEDGLSRSNMLLRFHLVASPSRDAGLRVLPPKVPQVLPGGLDAGFFQSRVTTYLVPLGRGVQIPGVEANASRLVRNLSLLKEVLHAAVEVENLL